MTTYRFGGTRSVISWEMIVHYPRYHLRDQILFKDTTFQALNNEDTTETRKKKLKVVEAIVGKPDSRTSGLRREGCLRILV